MKRIQIILLVLVIVIGFAMALAWPFMLIWNYAVVAAIQVANPINFWQALCLMVFLLTFIAGSNTTSSK